MIVDKTEKNDGTRMPPKRERGVPVVLPSITKHIEDDEQETTEPENDQLLSTTDLERESNIKQADHASTAETADCVRLFKVGDKLEIQNWSGSLNEQQLAADVKAIIKATPAEQRTRVAATLMGLTRLSPEVMNDRMLSQDADSVADETVGRLSAMHSGSLYQEESSQLVAGNAGSIEEAFTNWSQTDSEEDEEGDGF